MPKALNSESVQVNLQFTADTAQAKRELKQLQETLKSITRDPAEGFKLDKQLAEASRYAAELSVHLKKATNPTTGMLDFSRLNESIKKSGMSLSQYGDKLLSLGPQGRQAFSQLATAVSQSEIPIRRVNGALAQMGTVLKNTIRWQLSSTAIHAFSGAIQTAYNYAKDLNESLNNIRIVTGYNIDQMDRFAATANKAAKALSTSTLDYTNAALIYYQQGLSDKEVEARTNVTAKMANVTKQSAEEVSNQLTAIWNNYAKGADNLEYFADVITALGAATASSSQEISTGLEKFAAIGQTVGLSYEYATAALATVTATTRQSAEVVGNSFKTLFARIQGLKLGETQDDGTDLNKYSSALLSVGVNIKDASGELKDMDAILEETAAKWKTLGKEQQMALAQTVGGVRQYTQFIALMDNWDFMQKNLQTAYGSSGALQKQQDTYAEGWEAAAKRVKAAWEDVYHALINDEFFIDLLNFVEKAVNGFKNLIGAMGGVPGILTTIGSLMMTVFGKQMADGLTNMTYSIQSLTAAGRAKMISERQSELNQMGALATQHVTGNGDVDRAWVVSLQQRIALQDQLTQHVNELGETERFVAQSLQDQVIERQKLVDAAAHQVEQAKNELKLLKEQAFEEAQAHDPSIKRGAFDDAWKGIQDNTKTTAHFDETPFSYVTKKADMSAILPKIRDDAKLILQQYANQIESAPEGKNIKKNLETLMTMDFQGEKATPKFVNGVNELVGKVRVALTGMSTTVAAQSQDALSAMGVSVNRVKAGVDNLTSAEENLASASKSVQTAIDGVTNFIDTASQKTMTWQQQLVSFGQVAMSAGMVFNQLNGLISTWSNDDLSFGEQLFSSLTSIGMMLPMIISGYKSLEATINSITLKHQLMNTLQAKDLTLEQAGLAVAGLRKLATTATLTGEEKIAAAKALGIAEDKAGVALSIVQKVLNKEKLTLAEALVGQKLGILTYETLENGQLVIHLTLQKAINKVIKSNPIVAIIGAAIAGLMLLASILKKIKATEQERLQQQQDADKETLSKTKERIAEMQEESKELHSLVSALQETNDAYNHNEASKEDLFNATKNLIDQYKIENAELLLLQGNYKALTAAANKYEAEENQKRISELENKATLGFGSIPYLSFESSGKVAENIISQLTPEEQELITGKYWDAKTTRGLTTIATPNNAEDVVKTYDLLIHARDTYLNSGGEVGDDTYQSLIEQIKILQEYYDTAVQITNELSTRKDQQTGYDTFFGLDGIANYEADINNVKTALDALTKAYGGNKEKAEEYLKSIGGWDDLLIAQKALEQKAKSSGIDYNTLLNIYNSLSDSEKQVLFKINIAYGSKEASIIDAIKTGTAEVEMQIHQTNVNALSEASGNFKKGMTKKETQDWAKKYGVDFGDTNSTMGIDFNDFMAKTDSQKEAYMAQRIIEQQEQAYAKAQEILSKNKNLDLSEKQTLQAQKVGLESTLAHMVGVDPQTVAAIEGALKEVTDKLNTIYDTENASDIVDEERARNLERFTSALEKAKDLKFGDTITQDELNNFTNGIDKNLEQYFVNNGDGTWSLIVDKIDFQQAFEDSLAGKKLTEEQQIGVAEMATNYNQLARYQNAFGLDSEIVANKVRKLAGNYDSCNKALKKYNDALASKEPEKAKEAYDELTKSLRVATANEAAKNIRTLLKELANLDDASKEVNYKKIADELNEVFGTEVTQEFVKNHQKEINQYVNGTEEAREAAGKFLITAQSLEAASRGEGDGLKFKVTTTSDEAIGELTDLWQFLEGLDMSDITINAEGKADFSQILSQIKITKNNLIPLSNLLASLAHTSIAGGVENADALQAALDEFNGASGFIKRRAALAKLMLELGKSNLSVAGDYPSLGVPDMTTTDKKGGGGSKAQNYKKEEYRYESQTEKITDLEKSLDRVAKAKDRAFGHKRINLINQEIAALDKEIAAQKELIGQVEDYIEIDKNRLFNGEENAFSIVGKDSNQATWHNAMGIPQMLAAAGSQVQLAFDEFGNISNVEAVKTAINDWYNLQVDKYNSSKNEDEWAIAQEMHKWALDAIQRYGESVNKLVDEEEKLQDQLYQKQDFYAEQLNTKIEYRIQLEKNELALLKSSLSILNGSMFKGVEIFNTMRKTLSATAENASNLKDDLNKWLALKGTISDEAYREGLQSLFDASGASIEEIMSSINELSNYYSEFIDKYDSFMKFETNKFGDLIEELEYYNELASLTGNEKDYKSMLQILDAEKAVVSERLAANRELQAGYQDDYNKIAAEYYQAIQDEDWEKVDFLRPSVEAAKSKLDEMNEQVRGDIKQLAELAQKEFSTALDKIYYEAEQNLTGNLGFDYLSQTMDLASQRADEYLTKTNQIYETNQMLRDINRDIDKTTNNAAKTRLKNFSKEIEALQEKGELSHYELEDAKARYEILKAQIALEEAQNAKSTVRLQRDNEGNYGYIYTADQEEVAKAQDNLAKAQNDRYNLALNTQQEYLRKFYSTEQEAQEALRKLDEDYAAGRITSQEEYEKRRAEIISYYGGILQSYEDINTQALLVMNQTSAGGINDSWTNTFGDQDHGLIGKAHEWESQAVTDTGFVKGALETLAKSLGAEKGPIDEYNKLGEAAGNAKTEAENLRKEIVDNLLPKVEPIKKGISDIAAGYDGLYTSIHSAYEAAKDLNELMPEVKEELQDSGLETYTAYAEDGSTYTIHSETGNRFIEDSKVGDTLKGGDDSKWTHNADGSVSIVKNNKEYRYNGTWDKPAPEEQKTTDQDEKDTSTQEPPPKTEPDVTYYKSKGNANGLNDPRIWYDSNGNIVGKLYFWQGRNSHFDSNDAFAETLQRAADDHWQTFMQTNKVPIAWLASGGYTGEWGPSGKLAMLHEKELVLNADDTRNMLAAVQLVREISNAIDLQAQAVGASASLSTSGLGTIGQTIEQNVTIHAEFPNAVNHNEIEEAFNNLVNKASQYANRY